MSQNKTHLNFWAIWNMSFGFLGIQFGWGLQMANMSSIYEMLGADESALPLLWLAAPVTGLIVQPIVGFMSDRTWGRLGRRRPYFLVGAIFASLALIAMPNSSALWMAAGLLWILDTSVNISMEPFRAFVGDLLPKDQRKSGFAMQSLLIGLGAVLSSALPFILTNGFGVSKEATVDSPIPPSVTLAFYIGAGVFFAAVLYTIVTTKEHPPEDMEAFLKMKRESSGMGHAFSEIFHGIGSMPKPMRQLALVQFFTWLALFTMWIFFVPAVGKGVFGGQPLGVKDGEVKEALAKPGERAWMSSAAAVARAYEKERDRFAEASRADDEGAPWYRTLQQMFGLVPAKPDPGSRIDASMLAGLIRANVPGAGEVTEGELQSPMVLNFAASLRENDVTAPDSAGIQAAADRMTTDLAAGRLYQEGAAWGGVCFSMYNLTAFGFAFVLLWLTRFIGAKPIHIICLLFGAAGLMSAILVENPSVLLLSMLGVGIAWASILSMPYAMLANVIPGDKMGFYMGVFNFFIVLPQILAAVALGNVVDSFLGGDAMKAVLLGGASMGLAALLTLRVESAEHAA
jgi:maltose/moltooligosaccharide transporter